MSAQVRYADPRSGKKLVKKMLLGKSKGNQKTVILVLKLIERKYSKDKCAKTRIDRFKRS
jgi:hypothetical protein